MSHPQLTTMIAIQRRTELTRSAQHARSIKQAQQEHGIRVVHPTPAPQAPRSIWTRVVAAFEKASPAQAVAEPKPA